MRHTLTAANEGDADLPPHRESALPFIRTRDVRYFVRYWGKHSPPHREMSAFDPKRTSEVGKC